MSVLNWQKPRRLPQIMPRRQAAPKHRARRSAPCSCARCAPIPVHRLPLTSTVPTHAAKRLRLYPPGFRRSRPRLSFSVLVFGPLFQREFLSMTLSATPRPHCEVWENLGPHFVVSNSRIFDLIFQYFRMIPASSIDRRVVCIYDYSGWANVI